MSKNLKKITATAMLLALEIILSRFLSYSVWNSKIGFGFVAVALCGALFGPVYALILGGLADFLGAVLFTWLHTSLPILPCSRQGGRHPLGGADGMEPTGKVG